MVNRGEVWWGEHPDAGRRPYAVLTRQSAIPVLRGLVVVPATRTIRGIPTEVLLEESDGMPHRCALNFDTILTVSRGALTQRICRLDIGRLDQICRALRAATAC